MQAIIVRTDEREPLVTAKAKAAYRARHSAAGVALALARALELVTAGDLDAARAAALALREEDLPPVYGCTSVAELTPVLADCLTHGEQCGESGPLEGPAGVVMYVWIWYDPSHPV